MSRGLLGGNQSGTQPLTPATFTVPKSPEGAATAISVLSAGLSSTGPERSHPDYRTHPPLVEFGADTHIPTRVRQLVPQTEIVIDVPARYTELFVVAPLAYYLGATVRIGHDPPRLSAPGLSKTFGQLPDLKYEVAALLRRIFFLDCLVRDVPGEEPPYEQSYLDTMGIDGTQLRDATPTERLRAYLSVKQATIMSHLPSWHLSTYVTPTAEMIPCLPFLLDDLSLIYPPDADELDQSELLDRALDDFYRGDVDTVEIVSPKLQPANLHGWLADEVPADAFTPSLGAYRNRLGTPPVEQPLDITVVLNDSMMDGEYEAVAKLYDEYDQVTTRYRSVSVNELAGIFEQTNDFVHFIGHCEEDGLQCPDGSLDVESLGSINTRTFFLNACGSYYQGEALVEQGAIAGGVTLRTVLNNPAIKVGTTFARLFVSGFGIERAMQLARRQITMSTDYAVVGDGTYSLSDSTVGIARLKETGNTYKLSYSVAANRHPGGCYTAPFELWPRLTGTQATTELTEADIPRVLKSLECPVIYDESLEWADDLARQFLSSHE